MVSTFTVVAASMMLGQAPDLPPIVGQSPAPKEYIYSGGVLVPVTEAQKAAISGRKPDENNTPVLTWIKGLFKRGDDAPPHTIGGNAPAKTSDNVSMPPADSYASPADLNKKLSGSPSFVPRNDGLVIQQKGTTDAPVGATPKIAATVDTSKVATQKVIATKTEYSKVTLTPVSGAPSPILPSNANRIGRDEKFEWVTGQLQIEKGHFILYYATPDTVDPHHGRIQLNPQKVDMRQFQNGDLVSIRGQLSRGTTPVYQLTSADLIERPKR